MKAKDFSRRDAIRWAGGAAMATTFLPFSGKFAAWSHPAEKPLATRLLGRTGREVTTFGLAGGNKIQWELPGDEAVQIVVKAIRAGMTYIETANNYFLSQEKMGKAFEILNLKPGLPGYDHSLRGRLFIATKTALRHANRRFVSRFRAMEDTARERGEDFSALSLEQMDTLWEEAKRGE